MLYGCISPTLKNFKGGVSIEMLNCSEKGSSLKLKITSSSCMCVRTCMCIVCVYRLLCIEMLHCIENQMYVCV